MFFCLPSVEIESSAYFKSNSCNKFCCIYKMCWCENLKNSHRSKRYLQIWPITFLATHGGTGSCSECFLTQKATTNYISCCYWNNRINVLHVGQQKTDTVKMLPKAMNWKLVQTKGVMRQAGHKQDTSRTPEILKGELPWLWLY